MVSQEFPFCGWIIFHYMCTCVHMYVCIYVQTHICLYVYMCVCICTHHTHITLSLPPHLRMDNWIGSMSWLCEPRCSEHGEAQSSHRDDYCISFECMPRSGIAGPHDSSTFNFLRKHETVFHSGYTSLHVHRLYQNSFFTSLPTLVTSCLSENSHPDRCEVIAPCLLDWHFSDD